MSWSYGYLLGFFTAMLIDLYTMCPCGVQP